MANTIKCPVCGEVNPDGQELCQNCQSRLQPPSEAKGADSSFKAGQAPTKKSKLHPLSAEQKVANRKLSKKRILIENIIRKLKIFRILSERYRNRRKRFGLRFNLIAAIYNLELKL